MKGNRMEVGKKRRPQLREIKYIKALLWNNITRQKHTERKGGRTQQWRPGGTSLQMRTPHKQDSHTSLK